MLLKCTTGRVVGRSFAAVANTGRFRLLSDGPKRSVDKPKGNHFYSFFNSLYERGVGKQFDLEKEKIIWGGMKGNKTSQPSENLITSWKAFSDAEYGGSSKCESKVNTNTNVVSFNGRVDYQEDSAIRQTSVGGYCAMTGYCKKDIDLMDFVGLEVLIKTSKPCSFLFR